MINVNGFELYKLRLMTYLILERHKIIPVFLYKPTVPSTFVECGYITGTLSSRFQFLPFKKSGKNTLHLISIHVHLLNTVIIQQFVAHSGATQHNQQKVLLWA